MKREHVIADGCQVLERRAAHGWTQAALAEKAMHSHRVITAIENEEHAVHIDVLRDVTAQLGGDVDDYVKDNDYRLQPFQFVQSNMPQTRMCHGRGHELNCLTRAWRSPHINVLVLIGPGGIGKSALVNHWYKQLAMYAPWKPVRAYGWSFYSQGTYGQNVSSASFINHALTWFAEPLRKEGSAWQKGRRLAERIQSEPTLLVLDGLEPLMRASDPQSGLIPDPATRTLLQTLAISNPGLCIVTTRLKLEDLEGYGKRSGLSKSRSFPCAHVWHYYGNVAQQILYQYFVQSYRLLTETL